VSRLVGSEMCIRDRSCPVLKADDAAARLSRLRLCAVTRAVLADGLSPYGIVAPERM
jgi:arginyl-tRNA synthetase